MEDCIYLEGKRGGGLLLTQVYTPQVVHWTDRTFGSATFYEAFVPANLQLLYMDRTATVYVKSPPRNQANTGNAIKLDYRSPIVIGDNEAQTVLHLSEKLFLRILPNIPSTTSKIDPR